MLNHLLKIRNCKLKIAFFALILFLLMAKNVDASVINKSPNYLGSSNGLVGYWTMDGSKVNWKTGAVTDSSGRGNTGTITNMATSTGVAIGKIGQALSFDGTDDILVIGDKDAFDAPASYTIIAWIYPRTFGGGSLARIFDKRNNGSTGFDFFVCNSGCTAALAIVHDISNVIASDSNVVNLNKWQHVAVSWNGANATFYANGVAQGSPVLSAVPTANAVSISIGNETTNDRDFNGLIDEVRVYNRALSAGGISTFYKNGATPKFNVSPTKYLTDGLVGYWTMDGSKVNWATGAVTDSSGFNNTGTITNMATSTGVAIGKLGQALNFDGVNDSVNAGDIAAIDAATTLSVSAWVKHASITDDDIITSKGDTGLSSPFTFFRDNVGSVSVRTDVYAVFINGTTDCRLETATNSSPLDTWTHVAMTFQAGSATGLRIYINGVEDANSPASASTSNDIDASVNAWTIGLTASGATPFNGLIDEIRVYNRALSAKEIQTLYNIGATTKFNVSPTKYLTDGLVGYWTMDGSKV